jgi:hypothetical protein
MRREIERAREREHCAIALAPLLPPSNVYITTLVYIKKIAKK